MGRTLVTADPHDPPRAQTSIDGRARTFEDWQMLSKTTLLAAALTAGLATAAWAQPGLFGPGGWHGGGWHGDGMLDGVTLTDSRKTQLHALMKTARQNGRPLHEQMRQVHEKIDALLFSTDSVTEAQLAPLVQQEASLMQQVEQQHIENELAIRNLLTPDQLSKAASTHTQLVALHQQERALHGHPGETPTDAPAE